MKNKKTLVALIALLVIGVVGVTFAYFTYSQNIPNEFTLGKYGSELIDEFQSEPDWIPGEEVSKVVYIQNTGVVPMVARIKTEEVWYKVTKNDADEDVKEVLAGVNGTLADGTDAVIINGQSSDWISDADGEWLYYNKVLKVDERTTDFMTSVTLSSNLDLEEDIEYLPTDEYGVQYILTIYGETIQASGAQDEWGLTDELVAQIDGLADAISN